MPVSRTVLGDEARAERQMISSHGRRLALVVSLAAAVAGCGSSGGGSAGSPPTTIGPARSYDPGRIPRSASIASARYYRALVRGFSVSGQLSASRAKVAAHCIQSGLLAAGFRTQGQSQGANTNKSLAIVQRCVRQARAH